MKKYTFLSYAVLANSEDEAWENIQESMEQNEVTDCFICVEAEITFKDFQNLNPLGLNMEQLNNLTEENLQDYLKELEQC